MARRSIPIEEKIEAQKEVVSKAKDVSAGLRSFLDYVAGRKTENSYVRKLEDAVRKAKRNLEWRHEYMTLLMKDLENLEIREKWGIPLWYAPFLTYERVFQSFSCQHIRWLLKLSAD